MLLASPLHFGARCDSEGLCSNRGAETQGACRAGSPGRYCSEPPRSCGYLQRGRCSRQEHGCKDRKGEVELIHVVSHQGKTRALCPEVTRTPGQVSIRYWPAWHRVLGSWEPGGGEGSGQYPQGRVLRTKFSLLHSSSLDFYFSVYSMLQICF